MNAAAVTPIKPTFRLCMRFLADDAAAGMRGSIAYARLERTDVRRIRAKRSGASPPGVDRDRGVAPIGAADHAPGALRLAAGDDDVDVVRLEQRRPARRGGLELRWRTARRRRPRADASASAPTDRPSIRAPASCAFSAHQSISFSLVSKPRSTNNRATIGSMHDQRRLVVVDRGQAADELLLPGRARTEAGGGVAAAEEDADRRCRSA